MRLGLLVASTVVLVSQISFAQSDATIQKNVEKALGAYSITSISVLVQGGGVTLTGTVDRCSTKILADQLTAGVPGTKSILDRVQVAGPNVPDGELSEQIEKLIKDQIRRLGGFGNGSISVSVKNGVVTLNGYATPQLTDSIVGFASDMPGVKSLINKIVSKDPRWLPGDNTGISRNN